MNDAIHPAAQGLRRAYPLGCFWAAELSSAVHVVFKASTGNNSFAPPGARVRWRYSNRCRTVIHDKVPAATKRRGHSFRTTSLALSRQKRTDIVYSLRQYCPQAGAALEDPAGMRRPS